MDKQLIEELKDYPTATIERLIGRYQNVQKMHGPDSLFGKDASRELQPLFAEMARRQKAGLL
jgi:hypothetical protein